LSSQLNSRLVVQGWIEELDGHVINGEFADEGRAIRWLSPAFRGAPVLDLSPVSVGERDEATRKIARTQPDQPNGRCDLLQRSIGRSKSEHISAMLRITRAKVHVGWSRLLRQNS
jgi:hypothetical protein